MKFRRKSGISLRPKRGYFQHVAVLASNVRENGQQNELYAKTQSYTEKNTSKINQVSLNTINPRVMKTCHLLEKMKMTMFSAIGVTFDFDSCSVERQPNAGMDNNVRKAPVSVINIGRRYPNMSLYKSWSNI